MKLQKIKNKINLSSKLQLLPRKINNYIFKISIKDLERISMANKKKMDHRPNQRVEFNIKTLRSMKTFLIINKTMFKSNNDKNRQREIILSLKKKYQKIMTKSRSRNLFPMPFSHPNKSKGCKQNLRLKRNYRNYPSNSKSC